MNCNLSIKSFTRKDGTQGECLLLTTPKGTSFVVSPMGDDKRRNCKLVYKVCCEIKEAK